MTWITEQWHRATTVEQKEQPGLSEFNEAIAQPNSHYITLENLITLALQIIH